MREKARGRSSQSDRNKISIRNIFLRIDNRTRRRGRFLLGRGTKLELNSLAPGFSLGFHQIKLQEEKLLLKTREVKEPRGSTSREVRPKLRAGGKAGDGGGGGRCGRGENIPWWYSKTRVFSRDTKVTKVISGYIIFRISLLLTPISQKITTLSPENLSLRPGPRGPSITRKRDGTKSL